MKLNKGVVVLYDITMNECTYQELSNYNVKRALK